MYDTKKKLDSSNIFIDTILFCAMINNKI